MTLQQRAIHESAHALVAYVVKEQIEGVSARKDPLGEHAGFTKLARPRQITEDGIRNRLAVLMAGEIADLFGGADDEYREWASESDRSAAQRLAEVINPKHPGLAVASARLRAAVLVAGHWRALRAFAEDLEQRRSMNGPAAHILLEQAIRKHGLDPKRDLDLTLLNSALSGF